jgi:bacterioferritin-associated ferredoxin
MKCVCHNIQISEIVRKAKTLSLTTIEEIVKNIDCGKQCMLCHRYIIKQLNKDYAHIRKTG